jgi:hypothetical protein
VLLLLPLLLLIIQIKAEQEKEAHAETAAADAHIRRGQPDDARKRGLITQIYFYFLSNIKI